MKIQIGKGVDEKQYFSGTIPQEINLSGHLKDTTFAEFAKSLAEAFGVTDGLVELTKIEFIIKQ